MLSRKENQRRKLSFQPNFQPNYPQLFKKEEENKQMPEPKNDIYDSQQRKIKMPLYNTDHSMFSSTFRNYFLKKSEEQFSYQTNELRKIYQARKKKNQFVQTQSQIDEGNKEVPLQSKNYQSHN